MIDIGVGYYRINSEKNVIEATWYTPRLEMKEIGTGIVRGDTGDGFPGKYAVTYYFADGSEAGTYDLEIEKSGPIYNLSYSKEGVVLFIGVGIDTTDGMAIGYRKAE